MEKERSLIIAILSFIFAGIAYIVKDGIVGYIFVTLGLIIFVIFSIIYCKYLKDRAMQSNKDIIKNEDNHNIKNDIESTQITEIALLNEQDTPITYWGIYGKSSMVIGRDNGENNVDINLLNTTYASTIDVEHAVLNYSGGNWYIEDNCSKNGVGVIKKDGKEYKLNNAKPCLVEKGDIICISMERLKLC